MRMERFLGGAAVAALSIFLAPVTAGAVDLTGAGSTFAAPLYQAWIATYVESRPDVTISYDAVGSGEGTRRFIAGEVDFGASDAAMSDAQIAEVAGGVGLVPATAGMVVVSYNLPGVTGTLKLSRDALAGIFAGEITRWDDPSIVADNPEADLPNRTIAIVVRRDSSGTTFAFTNHLAAIDTGWRDNGPGVANFIDWPGASMAVPGNDGVAGRIAVAEYSIGYLEYGYATRLGLPMAEMQNRDGAFVAASARSGAAALEATVDQMPKDGRLFIPDPAGAGAYPIVTYSWILMRRDSADPEASEVLRDFVTFGVAMGQPAAEEIGYIPLPAPVVARARSIIDGLTPGL